MEWGLDDESISVLAMVRDFSHAKVRPRAHRIDERCEFPDDLVHEMGELGLMGIPFPEEYGGAGLS